MGISLDMDVGDILHALTKKKGAKPTAGATQADDGDAQNPYKNAMLSVAAVVIIAITFVYGLYLPQKDANIEKANQLHETIDKQSQLGGLDSRAKKLQGDLATSQERYEEMLASFSDSEDIRELYQSISNLAQTNRLKVINMRELDKRTQKAAITVEQVSINVELQGPYMQYIKFKEALSQDRTLLNVDSESIRVNTSGAAAGNVYVKLKLSAYMINKKPFQEVMLNQQPKKVLSQHE